MKRTKRKLSTQVKNSIKKEPKKKSKYEGDITSIISTGSTLLDLAITGGRSKGGGIPSGILVEIFGPSSSGKTVLLCEIAGAIQRSGGEIIFYDPEARLDKQFARMFDLDTKKMLYSNPDTVTELFQGVRSWLPTNSKEINGIVADSLAALSTDLEMDNNEGDKMGMRRAKEFSEQLRKTCRILTKNKYLMVCSNQIRINTDQFGQKYISPGGESLGFYSSLRLRTNKPQKIKEKIKVAGKEVIRVIGIKVEIEVFKSSVWKPYHTAPLTILFDYGIDDVRENLQFIKDYTKHTIYTIQGENIDVSMNKSITYIEENKLEQELKEEVIELWQGIEDKFESKRKLKIR